LRKRVQVSWDRRRPAPEVPTKSTKGNKKDDPRCGAAGGSEGGVEQGSELRPKGSLRLRELWKSALGVVQALGRLLPPEGLNEENHAQARKGSAAGAGREECSPRAADAKAGRAQEGWKARGPVERRRCPGFHSSASFDLRSLTPRLRFSRFRVSRPELAARCGSARREPPFALSRQLFLPARRAFSALRT
jgi:hypothetical protein